MAFKVKNLMIHVLPNIEEKSLLPSAQAHAQNCAVVPVLGWQFTAIRSWIEERTPPSSDPEALATLKGQLNEALANVQAQEQKVDEQTSPQTVEEAQALENHLVVALEEVRRQKEELQNKAVGGQG